MTTVVPAAEKFSATGTFVMAPPVGTTDSKTATSASAAATPTVSDKWTPSAPPRVTLALCVDFPQSPSAIPIIAALENTRRGLFPFDRDVVTACEWTSDGKIVCFHMFDCDSFETVLSQIGLSHVYAKSARATGKRLLVALFKKTTDNFWSCAAIGADSSVRSIVEKNAALILERRNAAGPMTKAQREKLQADAKAAPSVGMNEVAFRASVCSTGHIPLTLHRDLMTMCLLALEESVIRGVSGLEWNIVVRCDLDIKTGDAAFDFHDEEDLADFAARIGQMDAYTRSVRRFVAARHFGLLLRPASSPRYIAVLLSFEHQEMVDLVGQMVAKRKARATAPRPPVETAATAAAGTSASAATAAP